MPSRSRERELTEAVAAMQAAVARVRVILPQHLEALNEADFAAFHALLSDMRALHLPSIDPVGWRTSLLWHALPADASFDADLVRSAFLTSLDLPGTESPAAATSVRLPADVHEVAREAVDAGWASSLTELIVTGLRHHLGALAASALDEVELSEIRSALEEHYAEHPAARPPLEMVVQSAAELEGHPAAERPDLISDAIDDLGEGSFVEDVLAWVKGAIAREAPRQRSAARRR